jgi:hypothetical protein
MTGRVLLPITMIGDINTGIRLLVYPSIVLSFKSLGVDCVLLPITMIGDIYTGIRLLVCLSVHCFVVVGHDYPEFDGEGNFVRLQLGL